MNKTLIEKISLTALVVWTLLLFLKLFINPTVFDYVMAIAGLLNFAIVAYHPCKNYLIRVLILRRLAKKARYIEEAITQEVVESFINQGFTEDAARAIILSIHLLETPEDAGLLIAAITQGDMQSFLEIAGASINEDNTIYRNYGEGSEFLEQTQEPADPSCYYNANSRYLRCAIAPHLKTCVGCPDYKPK
jgi:hypothetical protein